MQHKIVSRTASSATFEVLSYIFTTIYCFKVNWVLRLLLCIMYVAVFSVPIQCAYLSNFHFTQVLCHLKVKTVSLSKDLHQFCVLETRSEADFDECNIKRWQFLKLLQQLCHGQYSRLHISCQRILFRGCFRNDWVSIFKKTFRLNKKFHLLTTNLNKYNFFVVLYQLRVAY